MSQAAEYKTIDKVEEAPWADVVDAADSTPAQAQARQLNVPGLQRRSVKFATKLALISFGCAVAAVFWLSSATTNPKGTAESAGTDDDVDLAQVNFPGGCQEFVRYNGCEKKSWTCTEAYPPDDGYRCCCTPYIWHFPHYSRPQPSAESEEQLTLSGGSSGASGAHDGLSVLRLKATSKVCLAGPKDAGDQFTLEECGNSGTRFKLPPRGAGPIELASKPGQCLSVANVDIDKEDKLQVEPCNKGSMNQMFQLTNGDKGMLQWSHGGNKCLDSENGRAEKLSKMVLADCIYWPLKPSQVFVLEDAPEKKAKKEKKDDDEEKEEDDKDDEEDKKENKTKTKEFKAPKVHPSLFCTSLMLPWSYEVDMMRSHLHLKIGIFACTGWAVFSNEKVKLADGETPEEDVYNDMMEGSLKAKKGGKFHTFLNTPVFVRFWKRLIEDGRPFKYDWTIKADPDSVFFPDRLTEMLINTYGPTGQSKTAVWLNNCQLGLHGPIEVFNNWSFHIYANDPSKCDSVAEEHGQEDVFLAACFKKLQIAEKDAYNLLLEAEWACNERPSSSTDAPPCFDRQVAFHPFKSVASYLKCHRKAEGMTWNTNLYMNGVPPSGANHHHA